MFIILAMILSITTPASFISPGGSPTYLPMYSNLPGIGSTMSACTFVNQGWCSFVGSLVTIIILACYKNVMEVVKGRKLMEVNRTFRRQHSRKLDGLSFPLDLAICRWPLGNSCVCYPLSPSHVT